MARFQFKLEPVLAHRRRLERQAQLAVAERAGIVHALHEELRVLNERLVRSSDELRRNRYLLSYQPVNTSAFDAKRVFLVGDKGIAIRTKTAQPPNIKAN